MLETRQDASLGVEALVLADRADVQELDCGALLEGAVAAASFENRAHAAAADVSDEVPGAEPQRARRGIERRLFRRLGGLPRKPPMAAAARSRLSSSARRSGRHGNRGAARVRAARVADRAGDPTQSRAGLISRRLNSARPPPHVDLPARRPGAPAGRCINSPCPAVGPAGKR